MRERRSSPYAEALTMLGLNEGEVLVYTHLVERGSATVKVLTTKLPLPRTLAYHILQELERKGLVVKGKASEDEWRTVYRAESPKKLYDLAGIEEKRFAESKNALYEAVPKLLRDYSRHSAYPHVEIIRDVARYGAALDTVLDEPVTHILSYEDPTEAYAAADVRERHERRRIARKIHKYVLCAPSPKLHALLKDRAYDAYTEFRVLPDGIDIAFGPCVMFGLSLCIPTLGTHEPHVVWMENAAFVDMQRSMFMNLWREAKPVTLAHIHV